MCVCVAANRVNLNITAQEYLPELGSQLTLKFVVTGQSDDQSVNTVKMINLQTPTLNITVKHKHTCALYNP